VAEVPDARGVRYYQSIGVVDRPVRYDGHRALYGFRHLLQLLAIRQYQREGHPLHLIRQALAGCPTPVLEQALESVLFGLDPIPALEASPASSQRAHAPAPSQPRPMPSEPGPSEPAREPPASAPGAGLPGTPLIAARLAPGVTITVDPALVGNPDALIARAAAILSPSHSLDSIAPTAAIDAATEPR
jgi:DNA-binding transcriptional MerR regulator